MAGRRRGVREVGKKEFTIYYFTQYPNEKDQFFRGGMKVRSDKEYHYYDASSIRNVCVF